MSPQNNFMFSTKSDLTEMEVFQEMVRKAAKQNSKYDYVLLTPEKMAARIYNSEACQIKNAIVIVEMNCKTEIWRNEDYHRIHCPRPIILCLKEMEAAGVCIGEQDGGTSYLLFNKKKADWPSQQAKVIGVVEIERYTAAFYFDWEREKSYYLITENGEESDLFEMMKKMLNVKEDENELGYSKKEWSF